MYIYLPFNFGGIQGLSITIFYTLAAGVVVAPLVDIFDVNYILYKVLYKQILTEKIKKKYFVIMSQEELNLIFEGPTFNIEDYYTTTINFYIVACFYSFLMPSGIFFALIISFLKYWVSKILIVKRFKEPPRLKKELGFELSKYLEIGMASFALGNLFFSYHIYNKWKVLDILCFLFATFFSIIPIRKVVYILYNMYLNKVTATTKLNKL